MKNKEFKAIFFAILAAALYAINIPISKLLLKEISPTLMASYLYLGAGVGMFFVGIIQKRKNTEAKEAKLTNKELPYTIGMVVLDILAPIFLMIGLTKTSSANGALLNNFEIVATSLIALFLFKETISKRLWIAISLITLSCIILTVEDVTSLSFSLGSVFVLLACCCWGLENNCTRKISIKDPLQIVIIKGMGSGLGSLVISLVIGEKISGIVYIAFALVLGFVSYGLSIFFYIYAQRDLGAAKTSAYYAIAPFIGVIMSLFIFKEIPSINFIIAVIIMIVGTYYASTEVHGHKHHHHNVSHEHGHCHDDGHHDHVHDVTVLGVHNHVHDHTEMIHSHKHCQDSHHIHAH